MIDEQHPVAVSSAQEAVPQKAAAVNAVHDQGEPVIKKEEDHDAPASAPVDTDNMTGSDPATQNNNHVTHNTTDKRQIEEQGVSKCQDEILSSSQPPPVKQEPEPPQTQTIAPNKRKLDTLEEEASTNAKPTTTTVCTTSSKKTKLLRRQESLSSPLFPGPKIIANTNPPLPSYRKKFDAILVHINKKYPLLAEKDRIRVVHDLFSDAIHTKSIEILEDGEGWSAGYNMSQWGTAGGQSANAATKNSGTMGPGVSHLLSQGFLRL